MFKKLLAVAAVSLLLASNAMAASVAVDSNGGVAVQSGNVKVDNKNGGSATVKTKKGNANVGTNGATVKTKKGGVGLGVRVK